MGLTINDGYIATFDYSVNFNLDTRVITFTDESTYTDVSGVDDIVFGVDFPTTGSGTVTISPNGSGTLNMPAVVGTAAIGLYSITGTITDTIDSYELVKTQNICKPAQCKGATGMDGCLIPNVTFKCTSNTLLYYDRTNYVYQSIRATSIEYDVYAVDPDLLVIADHADVASFTKSPIVNGRYSFTISNTATYDFGDLVTVEVLYEITNKQYTAACNVNLCDAKCAIESLYEQWLLVKGTGSTESVALKNKLDELNTLYMIASLQIECGDDGISDTIVLIEKVSGVKCDCNCGTQTTSFPICCEQSITITSSDNSITVHETNAGDTTNFDLTTANNPSACYSNTLFVSVCGDDDTGARQKITQPFATIKAAVEAASNGDLIYVFAGTYSESIINQGSDNAEKRLSYYFSPSVIVNGGSNPVFSTTSDAGTIIVRGAGTLQSNVNVITSNTVTMSYDIECLAITSNGTTSAHNAISFNDGTFKLKCSTVTATGNSCFDMRTGLTTGYVTCDIIDNSSSVAQAAAIHLKNITTSGTVWTFNVGLVKTNANTFFQAVCMDTGNTGSPKVYYTGNVHNVLASGASSYAGGIGISSAGTLIYSGDIDCDIDGVSGAVGNGGTLVINKSRIKVTGNSAALSLNTPPGNALAIINNSLLDNNSSTIATVTLNSAAPAGHTLQMKDCIVVNEYISSGCNTVSLNTGTQILIMDDVMMYCAGSGLSVTSSANINTRITNCNSNKTIGGVGVITNLIEAISVDSDLLYYVY